MLFTVRTEKVTSLSRLVTKPTKWLCAQRRLRSAWASAQSDQSLRHLHEKPWVLSYPLTAQRRLRSDWADAQTDPSLCWAHRHFVGFVMSWPRLWNLLVLTKLILKFSWFCSVYMAGFQPPWQAYLFYSNILFLCFKCLVYGINVLL